jgi:hypothetical protein
MAKMKTLIALTYLWILLAPLPPGIALNHQTKECGEIWGGDEYATYNLPAGWKTYHPQDGFFQTEIGSCPWNGSSGIESCCQQLGYTYVADNIGAERGQLIWTPYAIVLFCFKFIPLVLVLVVVSLLVFFVGKRFFPQKR